MRWLLIALAASTLAQVRHFDPPAPAPASTLLRNEMLRAHNEVRLRVGVRRLAGSDRLSEQAQDWANTLLANGKFAHRPHSATGENLFEIRGASATPAEVVDAWAAEASDYDYRSNLCHGMCGHYTQLVWRNTKEVGCAVARSRDREVWVCEYAPPGNYIGQRPY